MLLSICMMVKNEEKYLKQCLESIKPILMNIESELIIVDTGSTDKTVEIAKSYTDKVYFHPWNNNFSEMRNITFGYATGDWIFIIDGDEVLETADDIVKFFRSSLKNEFKSVSMIVKNLANSEDLSFFASMHSVRLFDNRNKDVYYEGAVHNQLRFKQPTAIIRDSILHYGYVNDDSDLMNRKFERTSALLLKELEKNPSDIHYLYQLGVTYAMHGDLEEARRYTVKAFEEVELQKKKWEDNLYVLLYLVRLEIITCNYDNILTYSERMLTHAEGYLDTHYYLAFAFTKLNRFEEAIDQYEKYLNYLSQGKRLKSLLDNRLVHYSVELKKEALKTMVHILSHIRDDKKLLVYSRLLAIEEKSEENFETFIKTSLELKAYDELKSFYISCDEIWAQKIEMIIENYLESEHQIEFAKIFSNVVGSYGILNQIRIGNNLEREKLMPLILNINNLQEYYSDIFLVLISDSSIAFELIKEIKEERLDSWLIDINNKYIEFRYKSVEFVKTILTRHNFDYTLSFKLVSILKILIYNDMISEERFIEAFKIYIRLSYYYIEHIYNPLVIEREELQYLKNDEQKFIVLLGNAEKMNITSTEYLNQVKKAFVYFPHKKAMDYYIRKAQHLMEVNLLRQELFLSFKNRQYDIFVDCFNKMFYFETLDSQAYNMAAIYYLENNEISEAEKILFKGLDKFPNFPNFYETLVYIYGMLSLENPLKIATYLSEKIMGKPIKYEDENLLKLAEMFDFSKPENGFKALKMIRYENFNWDKYTQKLN